MLIRNNRKNKMKLRVGKIESYITILQFLISLIKSSHGY